MTDCLTVFILKNWATVYNIWASEALCDWRVTRGTPREDLSWEEYLPVKSFSRISVFLLFGMLTHRRISQVFSTVDGLLTRKIRFL